MTESDRLREALQEALAHIDQYEDAMGHSYCDLNVGGGWASDECTCDFGAKRERWAAALEAAPSVPGEGLREDARALYEVGAGLAKQWAEVCAAVGLPDDASAEEVIEVIHDCPPECVHDNDCAIARALSAPPRPTAEGLDADDLATVRKALAIGFVSWDGDSWYARDAGYDYDDAEATLTAAQTILARLSDHSTEPKP